MADGKVGDLTSTVDLWPCRMALNLTCQPLKCAVLWDTRACQVSISTGSKIMANI